MGHHFCYILHFLALEVSIFNEDSVLSGDPFILHLTKVWLCPRNPPHAAIDLFTLKRSPVLSLNVKIPHPHVAQKMLVSGIPKYAQKSCGLFGLLLSATDEKSVGLQAHERLLSSQAKEADPAEQLPFTCVLK